MIELSHVTKTFGGATRALDDLTLTVPQGAVYGLVGSNGAGKTTAIRHITGIFRQDSGSVTIGGLPVYENPAVKSRIGYIPDDLGVFGGGTLRELAAFYRTMYPRFDAKRYAALRDVFRLDEATPLRRFSKGMQKHAAFWLTLSLRPDYLVLDEPVDGLDPVMRRQIWSLALEDVAGYGRRCWYRRTICASWRTSATMSASCTWAICFWSGRCPTYRTISSRCSS